MHHEGRGREDSTAPVKHARKGESTVKYTSSLKENRQFRRLYAKGKSSATPYLAFYCRRNGQKSSRLGITVGGKVGKAVLRNKVRRRLREIYRLHEDKLQPGYDLVVVARVKAGICRYAVLEQSFLQLAKKLNLLRQEKRAEQ